MERINRQRLEQIVTVLNNITGHATEPWQKKRNANGSLNANPGNYHLDGAYGGYALRQFNNEGSGERDVLYSGHVSKRELYDLIRAYIQGIEDATRA